MTKKAPHTISKALNSLYESIKSSGIVDAVYKTARPSEVGTKVSSFAVCEVVTRLRDRAERGVSVADTICRITLYVRAGTGNGYPATTMEKKEAAMDNLFPLHTDGISYSVLSKIPPTYDGVGFYALIYQLNTILM